jgi:sulfur-oxidizing protein SoxY
MIRKTLEARQVNRRELLALFGAGTVAAMGISLAGPALADAKSTAAAIAKVTGGKSAAAGKITLDTPQIAENGSTVPISVSVDSPMTDADHVKKVHVWAEGNPNPDVASFHFTTMSGKAKVSTRIRLAKTQNIISVAEMSDGSFVMAKSEIKVTIGGCGG